MRRLIGEALHALREAEGIGPEETRVHYVGRAVPENSGSPASAPNYATSPNDSVWCPSRPAQIV